MVSTFGDGSNHYSEDNLSLRILEESSFFEPNKDFFKYQNLDEENIQKKDTTIKTSSPTQNQRVIESNKNITINIKDDKKSEKFTKKRGRKKKKEERTAKHTQFSQDNEMKRIKTYLLNFIYNTLNKSFSTYHQKFLKISKYVNENLNKDYNLRLMEMTIKEIFENFPLNNTYSEIIKAKNYNKVLIKDILEKNQEKKVIEILNSKYIDFLEILRTKNIDKFTQDIYEREIENGKTKENTEKYLNDLKNLLFNYESWFKKKIPRNRKHR